MQLYIINGPNLNLLGKREKDIYGSISFESYLKELKKHFPKHKIKYFQSNHEGAIIDKLHEIGFKKGGVVLNAGAYTHTSIALADAIAAITVPVIEVHISNTAKREEFRHKSFISSKVLGTITGLGLDGYRLAIEHLINLGK